MICVWARLSSWNEPYCVLHAEMNCDGCLDFQEEGKRMDQNPFEPSGENLEVMVEKAFTPAEVSEILKIPERNVLDLLRSGRLKGFKAGKYWRVKESELEKFMEGAP